MLKEEQTSLEQFSQRHAEVGRFSLHESPLDSESDRDPLAAKHKRLPARASDQTCSGVSLDWLVGHYTALFNLTSDLINASQTCVHKLPKLSDFPRDMPPQDKSSRFEDSLRKIDKLLFDKKGRSDQPSALLYAFQKKMDAHLRYERLFSDIKAHICREAGLQGDRKNLLDKLSENVRTIESFAEKIYRLENLQRTKLQKYGAKPAKGLAASSLL